jgi:hypothetical protein
MKQSEQKNRRRLTELEVGSTLTIPKRGQDVPASERESITSVQRNDFRLHSRGVYVSLLPQRRAGVSSGLITEANSGSRQPTRYEARWVFAFSGDSLIPKQQFGQFARAE